MRKIVQRFFFLIFAEMGMTSSGMGFGGSNMQEHNFVYVKFDIYFRYLSRILE